ncbi:MAG: ATP-dependent DNA ligase [Candidatus Micrarchaeia archaeon]
MQFLELSEYYSKLESISSRLDMIDILKDVFKKSGKGEIGKIIYITQGVLAPPFEGIEFGLAEKMAEEAISIATGFSKEEANALYKKKGDLGSVAEELVQKSRLRRMSAKKYSVSEVYDSMLKISKSSGEGSKSVKIKLLAEMIASSTPLEARYLVRYPLGQLRMGVGDATILEALSVAFTGERKLKESLERAYNICSDLGLVGETLMEKGENGIKSFKVTLFKPIRPALAERMPTAEQILEKMHGKAAVEQKYDGFRCQVHKSGKKVQLYSRRLENITSMFPDIVNAAQSEIKSESVIFEGEALGFNEATNEFMPFQETMQRKRKHGIEEMASEIPLHLFAFDLMYLNGEDYLDKPYEKRRKTLEEVVAGSKTIRPSTRIITSSPKELDKFFEDSIEKGLEGIVAKDLESRYIAGARKFSWIKMKRSYMGKLSDTLDLVIVGYYLGRGSRSEFQFGGLLCAVYNKKRDMFETVSRIGTGFTEKQMSELKSLLEKSKVKNKPVRVDSLIVPDFWVEPRYIVTVKADEITKSPTHTCGRGSKEKGGAGEEDVGYALRFPRVVGEEAVRKDKSVEEATTTQEVIEMYNNQKRVKIEDS